MLRKAFRYFLNKTVLGLEKIVFYLIPKSVSHNEIAIIKVDAIGDFILWLNTASQYRELYPFKRLILIANKTCYDLAVKLPYWDEVLPIDVGQLGWRHPINRWRQLATLARRNFSVAIHPTYSRMILTGDSIVRATRAPTRIGSIGDLSNSTQYEKRMTDQWYTKLIPASAKKLPELERNIEFLKNLTGKEFELLLDDLPPVTELKKI